MAKSKAKRKQQASQAADGTAAKKLKAAAHAHAPSLSLTGSPTTYEPRLVQTVVPDEDLEIATDTLRALAANPSLIKSKACRDLRAAVFDFRQAGALASADGTTSLTSRVSGALADGRHVDARVLLAEMRVRGQRPKLGALCRWVRDLDVVSGLAEQQQQQQQGGGESRTAAQRDVLAVLDAILRVVGPVDHGAGDGAPEGESLAVRPAWDLRGGRARRPVYARVLDGKSLAAAAAAAASATGFRVLETTPGAQRKPPNHHPAVVHASRDGAIQLSSPPPATTHHRHPVVPNLHLLRDALTADECERIVGVAEKIGFAPDAPVRADDGDEVSVLAHNFYWIADEAFCEGLWKRVEPFVPSSLGGRRVRGLNRRFRVYRYVPGAEYRAHIDGAWPPSGISPDDKYLYDSSPPEAKQSSLFTFLIYLNDEFEGGETTYFLPGAREGTLNAYPLKPIQGSVALFPHGEVDGNLLHEGTGVQKGDRPSAKYVIRTDVEYDVVPQET